MLPHKTAKGQAALERLKVFEGIPPPYDKVGGPCAYCMKERDGAGGRVGSDAVFRFARGGCCADEEDGGAGCPAGHQVEAYAPLLRPRADFGRVRLEVQGVGGPAGRDAQDTGARVLREEEGGGEGTDGSRGRGTQNICFGGQWVLILNQY